MKTKLPKQIRVPKKESIYSKILSDTSFPLKNNTF